MADKNINWTMAAVLSLGVHAVILGALWCTSSTGENAAATDLPTVEEVRAEAKPSEAAEETKPAEPPKQAAVPKPSETVKPVETHKPAEAVKPVEPPKPVTVAKPPEAPLVDYEEYTVKRGDNLTTIARKFKSTTTELAALNGKTVAQLANLRVGQKIKVPRGE